METVNGMLPQNKELQSYKEIEEARKDSPLEPLEGAWPCKHFHFRFLVSRTVK
jgi:hypothetical protein